MVKAIRRLVLEQFGYIDVEIELDLSLEPDQMYDNAIQIERNLDAYKGAFWDLMKEKKQDRLSREQEQAKEEEAQKVEDIKARIAKLIESEPAIVKAKVEEFNGLIDTDAAAALVLKERDMAQAPKPAVSKTPSKAPDFPDTMTFFKGKYGWSLYTDAAKVKAIQAWIQSMPMEEHGRKNPELPKLSNNEKALYVNDKEKSIIEKEASRQDKKTFEKDEQ